MLELSNIETYRGRAQILRKVSLQVGPQESVALVGRNGAGKTTTIDSIIGLLFNRTGKITFQGKEIAGLPPYRRAPARDGDAPPGAGALPRPPGAQQFQIFPWAPPRNGQ